MDVSIIIVSYNTRELLADCLRSIHAQTLDTSFEILVVDNNSTDGSADYVREHFPRVVLIASAENLGFAGANNLAAARAQGEYLFLLNPDTVILDRAIDRLIAFARGRPQARIWGARTVFADGSLNPTCCYNRTTLWSLFCRALGLTVLFRSTDLFNPEGFGNWRYDSPRQVDIITGCCLLIPRAFWEELRGFDLHFHMYGEEVDLCTRARSLGARPWFTPEATIVHYGGASEASKGIRMVKVFKAKVALMKKHWPRWKRWVGVRLLMAWSLSRFLCGYVCQRLGGKPVRSLDMWIHVWRNRRLWVHGYDP